MPIIFLRFPSRVNPVLIPVKTTGFFYELWMISEYRIRGPEEARGVIRRGLLRVRLHRELCSVFSTVSCRLGIVVASLITRVGFAY